MEVDVPGIEEQYVVDGRIEEGRPPIVVLTHTQPYFQETDIEDNEDRFVHGANIKVRSGSQEVLLQELCSSEVPDSLLDRFSSVSGLGEEALQKTDICIYTSNAMLGQVGKSYELRIEVDGERIRASSSIPDPVPLDSSWFERYGDEQNKGLAWARIDDPDSSGNAYRWYAKRIQKGADGEPLDPAYIAPTGSVLDDRFFNGKSFEFNFSRGQTPAEREPGEEQRLLYETGDTIAVKWTSISQEVYRFYRTFEEAQVRAGSPFAQPTAIESNVDSALGIWAGFGVTRDTIVAQP